MKNKYIQYMAIYNCSDFSLGDGRKGMGCCGTVDYLGKRKVLRPDLNVSRVCCRRRGRGNVFQIVDAWNAKERWPAVLSLV